MASRKYYIKRYDCSTETKLTLLKSKVSYKMDSKNRPAGFIVIL